MKHFFLLFSLLLSMNIYATPITAKQMNVQLIAKTVAEQNCLKDMCFTQTLQAIAWQESSFGENIIGDSTGSVFFYKHLDKKMPVIKADTFIENGTRYTFCHSAHQSNSGHPSHFSNDRCIKKVYSKTNWKPLEESSLGAFQIQVSTARFVIVKMKLTHYNKYLSDEKALVNALLTDVKFGAIIAVNYLNRNYLIGQKRQKRNPWFFSVSRYNGGNINVNYVQKINQKIIKMRRWSQKIKNTKPMKSKI